MASLRLTGCFLRRCLSESIAPKRSFADPPGKTQGKKPPGKDQGPNTLRVSLASMYSTIKIHLINPRKL